MAFNYDCTCSAFTRGSWRCNATPPSMKKKSFFEALLTFDDKALYKVIEESSTFQPTKNLTGWDKCMAMFHNAVAVENNPKVFLKIIKENWETTLEKSNH